MVNLRIWPWPSGVRFAYSDASGTGYGGYMVEHGNLVTNGQWSEDDAAQSSTWHELHVVRLVLESFQAKLKDERVCWLIDSQNVVKIVQHDSGKPTLQAEALAIFSMCVKNHIHTEPKWIPREQNELADYYSESVDFDDYRLNPDGWALFGGCTVLKDLLILITPRLNDLTQDFGPPAQRL